MTPDLARPLSPRARERRLRKLRKAERRLSDPFSIFYSGYLWGLGVGFLIGVAGGYFFGRHFPL